LPSYEEFCQLEEYVKDSNKLKKEHVWKTSLDDPFGFGALPAGCCAQGHDFGLGKFGLFGHLREKFLIQENAVSKLEIWIMMN
jgi:hypothetical protein